VEKQKLDFIVGLTFFIVIIIAGIFYCLSQYLALNAVKVENRPFAPGLVWLQFVPLLGQLWQIVVVILIADSLRVELDSFQKDSELGIDPDRVGHFGERPTLGLGVGYISSTVIWVIYNIWWQKHEPFIRPSSILNLLPAILLLSSILLFVLYWVRLVRTKRKISRRAL
jgi:phosphotransferase system  glucose/maltose/N-acetylglucosamine-specific IIC component